MWRVHNVGSNGGIDASANNHAIKRPFKCAYCNHASGLSGNVRKHVMNMHPDLPVEYVDLRKAIGDGGGRGGGGTEDDA